MKLYLFAALITIASTVIIVNTCILHVSSSRAVSINLVQFK